MKCKHCGADLQEKYNDETKQTEYVEYVLGNGETRCDACKGN